MSHAVEKKVGNLQSVGGKQSTTVVREPTCDDDKDEATMECRAKRAICWKRQGIGNYCSDQLATGNLAAPCDGGRHARRNRDWRGCD